MTERLGNHIPPSVIKSQIYANKAFLYKDYQFGIEYPRDRRFFILNQNPLGDSAIITVHATTNIAMRKAARKNLPEVLVEIPKGTRSYIPKDSIVDCESYIVWRKQKLEKEIESGIITSLEPLPTDKMKQLYQAISLSRTISDMDIRLILEDER